MLSFLLCCACLPLLGSVTAAPPVPAWPEQFSVHLTIYVEQFGSKWSSQGNLYYNYTQKTFRADYIDWCLPLFDDGPTNKQNYACTFLATHGNMYFVNHTSHKWDEDQCCLLEKGLAAVPPDWMKNDQYNGTQKIRDVECDAWWFPGTNHPSKPCYGYWNAKDKDHTPVQFFGLSSVGPTILQYSGFMPGKISPVISLAMPNALCEKVCEPGLIKTFRRTLGQPRVPYAPPMPWPTC